ncbi:PASTA domain-containing protein [Streptomyces sp. TG1A-60]|uniref:PASTA domain-containing protein n=1 Tax=Streptomyces sp. TG1A-60 TaxID=3129111 RepID=UPI0030CD1CF9
MGVVILSGCGDSGPMFVVKAVAAGVPSLAPFFDESKRLGRDERDLASLDPHSGLQQGNTPGLYGGTRKPKICDVRKLENFLTAPENRKKAQEWARIAGIKKDGIGNYLEELTPVLLRHDTLVKNHDYKKGKAVPFDALLEAGIAVLVDDQGLPAVKCGCGNPLRAFDGDPGRITVEFADGNDEWYGFDKSDVVVVKPAPSQLTEIKLVDVENPDQGIIREVGTTGESDKSFDTRVPQAVPQVRGMTFGEAGAAMADKGLAVAVAGDGLPPSDAPVTGSSPGPGTRLTFGAAVALHVDRPAASSKDSTEGSGPGSGSGSDRDPGSDRDSGSGSTGTDPDPTGPSGADRSPSGGSPTGRGSPSTGGGSSPTDKGSASAGEGSASAGGGMSLAPTPSKESEKPPPDPAPTATVPSAPPAPSRSTRAPSPPGPAPPVDGGPPADRPTTSDPGPPGDPPSDGLGDPVDPSGAGAPAEDPAQPVRP